VLQFMPWQEGSVIRAFGAEPIIKKLMALLRLSQGTLLIIDPSVPNMWLTTIGRTTEAEFKKWPRLIEKESNLRAELVSGEKQRHAEQVGRASATASSESKR